MNHFKIVTQTFLFALFYCAHEVLEHPHRDLSLDAVQWGASLPRAPDGDDGDSCSRSPDSQADDDMVCETDEEEHLEENEEEEELEKDVEVDDLDKDEEMKMVPYSGEEKPKARLTFPPAEFRFPSARLFEKKQIPAELASRLTYRLTHLPPSSWSVDHRKNIHVPEQGQAKCLTSGMSVEWVRMGIIGR